MIDITRDVNARIVDVQSNSPRHLARLSRQERLMESNSHDYVFDPTGGNGVDVYVFDSGISKSHPSFDNRVMPGMDFTGEGFGDQNGHGKKRKHI